VAEQRAERSLADVALAQVLVPVPVRPERDLGIVHVQAGESLEADLAREPGHDGVGLVKGLEWDPRGEQVLGVEADSDPGIA
jgi:hypothetical protein